jgi:hypothetical protein
MMRWLFIILVLLAAPAVGQPRRTFTQDDLRQAEAARDAALARVKALEQASSAAARAVTRSAYAVASDAAAVLTTARDGAIAVEADAARLVITRFSGGRWRPVP